LTSRNCKGGGNLNKITNHSEKLSPKKMIQKLLYSFGILGFSVCAVVSSTGKTHKDPFQGSLVFSFFSTFALVSVQKQYLKKVII
jgi:hypothetical protein